MEIYNKEKVITNQQLNQIISLLGENYFPRNIALFETRSAYFSFLFKNIFNLFEILFSIPFSHITDFYNPFHDRAKVFIYNHECNYEDLQYETIYSLVHCLRVRHYYYDYLKEKDIGWDAFQINDICHILALVHTDQYDILIDKFDKEFMTQNAQKIADIMNWADVLYPEDELMECS